MDTSLLPFSLNTFEIQPEHLGLFIKDLTNTQRDAIATFKVGQSDIPPVVDSSASYPG
jgi:hypothetical protein